MVQINLNYIAAAFVLLTFSGSIQAWSRMYWYGHVLIVLSSLFFRSGGRHALKAGLGDVRQKRVPSFQVSPPSPVDDNSPTWVKDAFGYPQDKNESGLPEELMDGAEEMVAGAMTPREEYIISKEE